MTTAQPVTSKHIQPKEVSKLSASPIGRLRRISDPSLRSFSADPGSAELDRTVIVRSLLVH